MVALGFQEAELPEPHLVLVGSTRESTQDLTLQGVDTRCNVPFLIPKLCFLFICLLKKQCYF